MEHNSTISHDTLDRFVASVFAWCERAFSRRAPEQFEHIAFSDEWERKQIVRELHWN